MILAAIQAVEALGLHYGAADVIWLKPNAYVLEVNTSPTLNSSELTTSKYAKYFNWLCQFGRKKWDYNSFEKGSSLIWKNNQFETEIPVEKQQTNNS